MVFKYTYVLASFPAPPCTTVHAPARAGAGTFALSAL